MNALLILQQIDVAAQALANQPDELKMNFWQLAMKGGWIMIPLLLLWVIAVYIFFERFWAIKKASRTDENFMNRIKEYIHEDKIEAALALCRSNESPVSRIFLIWASHSLYTSSARINPFRSRRIKST